MILAGAVVALVAWRVLREDAGPRPNVLLVTIDTLRADALGEDTPALLELAARGTRYRAVRTPAPLTLPAHASLLSGVAPPVHGVRDNTAAPLPPAAERDFRFLAEELRDQGYATAAFVASAVLDRRYRLDAGFDVYQSPPPPTPTSPGFPSLDASEQVARFRRWLAARPADRPFLAWVHLWEPHAPYRAYDGDARRPGTDADLDPPAVLYRGEVRKADAAVEALLALIDPATTVVVVTSDHGESLGEHGEATHGYLCHGATMDVPLVLAGPGVPGGREVAAPCSLLDVAPTLRSLCGLAARGAGLPAAGGGGEPRVLVGESLYAHRRYGWAQVLVAFDGAFSLVDAGPRVALYDLRADPGETAPLADHERRPAFERLDRALQEYRRRGGRFDGGAPLAAPQSPYGALTRDVRQLLPPAENRALRDVASHLASVLVVDRLDVAIYRADAALAAQLLDPVRALERDDPKNPAAPLARGRALLLVLDRPREAAAALREAYARGYAGALGLVEEAYRRAGDAEGLAWVEGERKKPPR